MHKRMDTKKILFVCLGNICRSPAAHAVMQKMVDEKGLSAQVEIDSAGLGNWHVGQLPDARMRKHGARRGYAVNHLARQFHGATDFARFHYIVVMDAENYRGVMAQVRDEADGKKVLRMGDFLRDNAHYTVVLDPYYGGPEDFELALDLIEEGCRHLLESIIYNKV